VTAANFFNLPSNKNHNERLPYAAATKKKSMFTFKLIVQAIFFLEFLLLSGQSSFACSPPPPSSRPPPTIIFLGEVSEIITNAAIKNWDRKPAKGLKIKVLVATERYPAGGTEEFFVHVNAGSMCEVSFYEDFEIPIGTKVWVSTSSNILQGWEKSDIRPLSDSEAAALVPTINKR
jgi:hypothetical protein